ncbi:MAG TPA: anti-sigma factor [Bryobacteraceae bacterium]|nr:anti-sigma factor [Bryobacteraceae bacterium]
MRDLNDYLDDTLDPGARESLQKHVDECPNCWVVCDTTAKTLRVYKGMEAQAVPMDIQSRLMAALEKKMEVEGPCCRKKHDTAADKA